jgi:hypothetical protein
MINIRFIVLSCDKYLNTRVESIRNTWGKNKKITFLSDSKSELPDVLGFNTRKDYFGIFEKYLNFFKTFNFLNEDYFFFADDDTFIHLKNLEKLKLPNKNILFCIGRVLCLNPDGTDIQGVQTGTNVSFIHGDRTNLPIYYPSGGSGFILSQESCISIQKYLNNCTDVPYSKFSDVSVGFWMRNCQVELIGNNNFWWDTHEKLVGLYSSDEDAITHHYVNDNLMLEYHKKYNQI